jgi:hypothetical protein
MSANAAISCGSSSCAGNAFCYADAGKCSLECGPSACKAPCCSGMCTGSEAGACK